MSHDSYQATNESGPARRAHRWQRRRPDGDFGQTTLPFWLSVLGLGCLCLLTVTWLGSSVLAEKGSGKLLRVDQLFPKLKSIHPERKAAPFPTSAPGPRPWIETKDGTMPPVIDLPRPTVADPVQPATPEPPRLVSEPGLIPPLELAPPIATCLEPVVFMHQCSPQRGDTPMIRNWKSLTMYSFLTAAAVALAPPPAFATEPKKDQVEIKGLEELQKSINELVKRIDVLEKKKAPTLDQDALSEVIRSEIRAELKKFKADTLEQNLKLQAQKGEIDNLAKEVADLRKALASAAGAPAIDKAFMEEFRTSLRAIQETFAKMAPTKERVMMSPPNGSTTNAGRVMLVNNFSDELLFIINGVGHRLPANTSKLVDPVPVGGVSIEVFSTRFNGVFHRQATTLAAGELFTLTANPPR